MKQFYLLIISIICMTSAHAVNIEHTVSINTNDVEFTDTIINGDDYVLPYIKGIDNRAEYGQPSLPRIIVSFALPNDAKDITVSAINTELYNSISIESPIMPYLPEVSSKRGNSTPTSTDPSNYKGNECIVEISHIENFKDINKIVSVCVCPILYDPINSIADIYSKCIFSIKYDTNNSSSQSNKTASSSRDYLDDIAFLKTIVANPDVLKGYADFGTFAYKPPRISDYRPGKFKTKDADPYYPLLQEGKEWRYTMYNPTIKAFPDFIPGPLEVNRVIRLENPIEIDGEVYFQANAYYDGEHQHDEYNPIVYIREDESSKKVIVKLLTNRDDIYSDYYTAGMYSELYFTCTDGVLYDFNNPLECHVANRSEGAEEKFFDCLDGPHRGFDMQTYVGDLAIVEGIGCVHNDSNYSYSYDLFGFACSQLSSLPDWCYLPYLYEVANADGTVIYRNPKFAPGWTSSSSVISDSKINISVVDGNIVARCPSVITEMSVFNLQGMEVARGRGESGEISLSTAGLSKGVYMIQCGEHIQKVILK